MRQFLLFFFTGFLSFPALAISGWNYTCPSSDKETTKVLIAEEQNPRDRARLKYNLGICHLVDNEIAEGMAALNDAAQSGDHAAITIVADYYISDGFLLPQGQVTDNKGNLQKAIHYDEQALRIMSQPNYPFNDPYGGDAMFERKGQLLLSTASGLALNRLNQFIDEISSHRDSINQSIGDATLVALHKTIVAANNCTDISREGRESVWNLHVYNKFMDLCEETRNIAQTLWSLEHDRLRVADSYECRNKKLSDCEAHIEIENEMLAHYNEYDRKSDQLLASL